MINVGPKTRTALAPLRGGLVGGGSATAAATTDRRTRTAIRAAAVALILGTVVTVGETPAYAEPVEPAAPLAIPGSFTAEHGAGTASGTYRIAFSDGILKKLSIRGRLDVSAADECYRTQLVVTDDVVTTTDLATQCGFGSTTFTGHDTGLIFTTTFGVRVCRLEKQAVDTCGATTELS